MNFKFSAQRRSVLTKVSLIGILILALLMPLGMIKNVVLERISVESMAVSDIRASWGGEQTVAGPVLRLPFKDESAATYGEPYPVEQVAYILADELANSVDIVAETRYRGIHKVPVYTAEMVIDVRFDLAVLASLDVDPRHVLWDDAEVLLGVTDAVAINKAPKISALDLDSDFQNTTLQLAGLPAQLGADVGELLLARQAKDEFTARIVLAVNGTESLQFLPLAESATVNATANWASPSFTGRRLPSRREVAEDGFSATWQTTSLARKIPVAWLDDSVSPNAHDNGGFGVRFMQPIGLYQLMFRALTYGVMFVGLTFVAYFLIETLAKLQLHPLQYLLVGLANTLFYLLLLSFAEHIGFGWAYAISATASATLIVSYSATVLSSRRRAGVISIVLLGLYAFLYLTLTAETLALLAGSIGLWLVLAAMMYLTRNINWYSNSAD